MAKLIERALPLGSRRPQVIACGSRSIAYQKFQEAIAHRLFDVAVLLVDAEGPVETGRGKWLHVRKAQHDQWECPAEADDSHLYFMAECMEAWLVADRDALKEHYGRDFNPKPLEACRHPERTAKAGLFDALKKATRDTNAGPYDKGRHSFRILERVNPDTLRARCPDHAAPFLSAIAGLMIQK